MHVMSHAVIVATSWWRAAGCCAAPGASKGHGLVQRAALLRRGPAHVRVLAPPQPASNASGARRTLAGSSDLQRSAWPSCTTAQRLTSCT